MKKIKLLLHDVTIINFRLFITLVRRYLGTSLTLLLLFVLAGTYKYNSQHLVYSYSVGFKNFAEASNSPSKAIMEMLGEKTRELTEFEVEGLLKNVGIRRDLAERIVKREDFRELNFNSTNTKNILSHDEMFSSCNGNKECLIERLEVKLKGFLFIQLDGKVEDQFSLITQSLDENTAKVLLYETAEAIQIVRVGTIKQYIRQQITITEDLQLERKKEISSTNILDIKVRISTIKEELHSINVKINEFQKALISEQGLLNNARAVVEQNKVVRKKSLNYRNVAASQKAKNLMEHISSLRENIEIISLNQESSDSNILADLKTELNLKRKELKMLGDFDGSLATSSLKQKQGESKNNSRFEYDVLTKRYARSKQEHQKLLNEKSLLVTEKSKLDKLLEMHAPSLEYFKILDKKISQLKLTESTIISDLIFEKYNRGLRKIKKLSLFKTFGISFMLAILSLFLVIVCRYILDDRIYDERELAYNSESLKIIGKTPEFI